MAIQKLRTEEFEGTSSIVEVVMPIPKLTGGQWPQSA